MRNTWRMNKLKATLFFSLLFLSAIGLYAQIEPNLDNKFRLAQSYEVAGRLEKAESLYKELYDTQPWNYTFFESLNKVLVAQKKYDKSVELLNQKILQTPNDYNLYGLLGSTYYIMDQSQKAYETWDKGTKISPESTVGYRVIANYAIENRAFDKAIDILKKGKEHSADPTVFSFDLGNIYAANMKFKDAAEEFCFLIEKHPEQLAVVKSRIMSYINRPDATQQTIDAVKSIAKSKAMPELYDLLTFVFVSSENFKDAFENVVTSENIFHGNGTNMFILAQDAFRTRQYDWAAEAYNFILKNYSNSPYTQPSKIGYARTLESSLDQKFLSANFSWKPLYKPVPLFSDEYKKIIEAYNEFVKGYPDNAINIEALFRIAEIYRTRLFDYSKADSLYKKISEISPTTNYAIQSNIFRGKMAIENDNLNDAEKYFAQAAANGRIQPNDLSETKFYLGRINFWKGNFTDALKLFNEATKNLSTDFSNDALELSALIGATKKDSINLVRYSHADMLALQNKMEQAATEFKTLADNPNVFILNDFAKIKLAEILIAKDDLPTAIKILEELTGNEKSGIFSEKANFLLARCYQYGVKNLQKAAEIYEKLLEKFPNSLYFDRARTELNKLQTKNG